VQLLWAGNEQIDQGDCHASPHVAEAERLLLEARRLLASCARSAVAAPPSVTQPRPRPTPKQVPGTPTTEELSIPKNVHFALNQHALGETSRRVIAGVVSVLEKYPSLTLRLEGHTDSRASAAYNLALSKRRVAAVRAEMIALGIDPARIQAAYLGKSSLKAVEDSAINLARNRRVEMVFIDSGGMVIHAVDQEQDLQLEGGAEHKK